MRTRRYTLLLFAAVILAGCTDKMDAYSPERNVKVVIDAYCVKMPQKSILFSEDAVNTLDVLIFREEGALEAYRRSNGRTVSVEVSAGIPLEYYVVANAPAGVLEHFADKSSFLDGAVFLADNTEAFVMSGSGKHTFSGETESLDVNLDRYVSKIRLDSITPEFMDGLSESVSVMLNSVFLVNVSAEGHWDRIPFAGDLWYNKMTKEDLETNMENMLEASHGTSITDSTPLSLTDVFYCMPNPTDNDVTSLHTPQWSARDTRLVIDILIGGVHNYYPINIPGMSGNKCYRIKNAILIGPGSSSPDILVERVGIKYSIEVADWGDESMDIVMD